MKRSSGVLMHISSLYGDYSCGSFGKNAFEFIDFLKNCGFTLWQVLPFGTVDECNSPYRPYSAFGFNPFFTDLEILKDKGLLTDEEILSAKQKNPYLCEFERLKKERFPLLKKASQRCSDKEKESIRHFLSQNPHLDKFCEFMALKTANADKEWILWENETGNDEDLFAWQFIQYEFYTQWMKVKEYANKNGIEIVGDIPFYVSYDSADVWANKNLFKLHNDGRMKCVAGVPPDYFSKEGQLWGNPIYDWAEMKKDGYKWWCDRINRSLKIFDKVRIDHFRAIESYWETDASEKSAVAGKWQKGPGMDFINKIKEIASDQNIICEDLGMITDEVRELVKASGFSSMGVMQFGFLDDADSVHLPHNYTNKTFSYTGTHDNNTLLGYVWELDNEKRKNLMEYCGFMSDDFDKCYDNVIRTMFASSSGAFIMPIQDLLLFGSDTRLNIPGKADGNWKFRITKEQLMGIDIKKYKRLNELYKR